MHGPLFPQKTFTAAPHTFHTLCVCSSSWVHKMNGVIDCLVFHTCCLSNSSVGGPFITEHYTARTNILLDEREECGGISVLNLHQEALSCYSFGPPKHPVTFNLPASVVLSFSKFTLINLYFNSWTSNDGRVIYKILGTDVPYKIVPVNSCLGSNLLSANMYRGKSKAQVTSLLQFLLSSCQAVSLQTKGTRSSLSSPYPICFLY